MRNTPNRQVSKARLLEHSSNKVMDLVDYWIPTAPPFFRNIIYRLLYFPFLSIILLSILISILLYFSLNPFLSGFISILFSFIIIPISFFLVLIIYYIISRGYSVYDPDSIIERIPYKVSEHDSLIIVFDAKNKYSNITISDPADNIFELPHTIKEMLHTSSNDIHRMFILLHGGRENRPLVRLAELRHDSKTGSITLVTGNTSYTDFWFIHHFSDYALARRVSKESKSRLWSCGPRRSEDEKRCEQFVTTRSTLYPYLMDYYSRVAYQDIETSSGIRLRLASMRDGSFKTAPILPNGLGITGIVRLVDKENTSNDVLLLQRRSKGHVDSGRLQWSFAGLVGSFDDLFERRNYIRDYFHIQFNGPDLTLLDLCWEELQDEVLVPIGIADIVAHADNALSILPIALIFNAEKLFQPELVLEVKIAVNTNIFNTIYNTIPHLDDLYSQPDARFALLNTTDVSEPDRYQATINKISDVANNLNITPRYLFMMILELYRIHSEWD